MGYNSITDIIGLSSFV